MARKGLLIGFGSGLIAGLIVAVSGLGDRVMPRARAQGPADMVEPARFQVSAWAYPGSQGSPAGFGAYVVDQRDGRVWSIVRDDKPGLIGAVK